MNHSINVTIRLIIMLVLMSKKSVMTASYLDILPG